MHLLAYPATLALLALPVAAQSIVADGPDLDAPYTANSTHYPAGIVDENANRYYTTTYKNLPTFNFRLAGDDEISTADHTTASESQLRDLATTPRLSPDQALTAIDRDKLPPDYDKAGNIMPVPDDLPHRGTTLGIFMTFGNGPVPRLAYKIELGHYEVVVDAHTGEILEAINLKVS